MNFRRKVFRKIFPTAHEITKSSLVSIIMPAYNAAGTIIRSIDSVLKQTYDDWELIIVNDGSSDQTQSLVTDTYAADARIRTLHLPKNGGLPNARNQGIQIANGEFIAFLDSDDLWYPDKLALQIDFHRTHPDIGISHTAFEMFNDSGVVARRFATLIDPRSSKEGDLYPSICYRNPVGVLTVMAKKEVIVNAGMFDVSLWTFEDQDLWIRIAKQGVKFGYLPKVLASYKLSQSGITSKTGRYKLAYKKFIRKTLANDKVNERLLWRYYFRYFGTVYFKRGELKLSRIYFCKSLRLKPFDSISLTTLIYLAYGVIKGMFTRRSAI